MRVLAVDPGMDKCGIAVCDPAGVIAHRAVSTGTLADIAREWAAVHRVDVIIVGNRTGSKQALALLGHLPIPVRVVEERDTSLNARRQYFRDHPPRGWRRLLPLSLQVPPEPYDDYAAILLAEAFLAGDPR